MMYRLPTDFMAIYIFPRFAILLSSFFILKFLIISMFLR